MPTLTVFDASGSLQEIDASLALPSPLTSTIADVVFTEEAVTAAGALTFGRNVTDTAFGDAGWARLSGVNSTIKTASGTPISLYTPSTGNSIVFRPLPVGPQSRRLTLRALRLFVVSQFRATAGRRELPPAGASL